MTEHEMKIELLRAYSHRELSEMYIKAMQENERLKDELAGTQEMLEAAIAGQERLQAYYGKE